MSEKTTVKFTQLGREISFSAGYIVAITHVDAPAFARNYEKIYFEAGVITQLGVVPVDGTVQDIMSKWHEALAAPPDPPSTGTVHVLPRGNNAEF